MLALAGIVLRAASFTLVAAAWLRAISLSAAFPNYASANNLFERGVLALDVFEPFGVIGLPTTRTGCATGDTSPARPSSLPTAAVLASPRS
jgi:hypothetical protein